MCNNIKKIRIKKGFTQKELASRIDVSQQFISDVENMKIIPSLTMAFKIQEVLGVDLKEIFYLC